MAEIGLAGLFDFFFVDDQSRSGGGISMRLKRCSVIGIGILMLSFYLIGADHVPTLQQWRRAPELAQLVEFLIVPRPGEAPCSISEPFSGQYLKDFARSFPSTLRLRLRERLSIRGLGLTKS